MPHIHELIDETVAAYIVHRDSVLLVHHKALQKWLPLGGHIELDEDSDQALFREIKEESGIDEKELEVYGDKPNFLSDGTKFLYAPIYRDIHQITDTHRHVGNVYFLRSSTDRLARAEEEHLDIRWFKGLELDDSQYALSPAVKFYATEALRLLGVGVS